MVTDDILVKYLVGEAEPHEVAMVEQWRKASAENEKHLQQFQTLWEKSASVKNSANVNVDIAWKNVQQKINAKTASKGRIFFMDGNRKWLAAASIALLLGISIFLFRMTTQTPEEMLTTAITIAPQNLQLHDGSKIMVSEGSFSYPQEFKGNKRKVILNKGKAFFDIASDKEKPFEIAANNTLITVVGTEFEIITENDFTQVRVKEGKVKFNTPNGEMLLTAGMGAMYNRKNNTLANIHTAGNNTFSYASGVLEFKNQTLKQVVSDLNACYQGRIIELDNRALENCRITSSFKNDKLETVLNVISVTLNLEIVHSPDSETILIKGEGCN